MKLVCYFDIAKLRTRNISRPESVMFIKFGFPSKNGSAIWKFHLVSYDFAKWLQDLFFKEWVLGHVYNRRIKWLAAANCIKNSRRVEVMFAHTALPNWIDSEHRKWRPKNSPQHPGRTLYNGLHGKSPPEMGTFFRPGGVKSLWYFIIHSLCCNYLLYIFMGPSTLNMEPSSKT